MVQNSISNTKKSASVKAESSNKRSNKVGEIRRKAHGWKDTFWNQQRVNAGVTYDDIARYLNCSTSMAARFFSGILVPKEEHIDRLCDWFGVDRVLGEREFRKANREWDTIHDGNKHPKLVADGENEKKLNHPEKRKVIVKTSTVFVKEEKSIDISGLSRASFDIFDYDDFVSFTKILARKNTYESEEYFKDEIIEFIGQHAYGSDKCDYKKYNHIMKLIG